MIRAVWVERFTYGSVRSLGGGSPCLLDQVDAELIPPGYGDLTPPQKNFINNGSLLGRSNSGAVFYCSFSSQAGWYPGSSGIDEKEVWWTRKNPLSRLRMAAELVFKIIWSIFRPFVCFLQPPTDDVQNFILEKRSFCMASVHCPGKRDWFPEPVFLLDCHGNTRPQKTFIRVWGGMS